MLFSFLNIYLVNIFQRRKVRFLIFHGTTLSVFQSVIKKTGSSQRIFNLTNFIEPKLEISNSDKFLISY